MDTFSENKQFLKIGDTRIAYYEEGKGTPVLLLHGCPFSSFIWRKVIPILSSSYRCLAPDLLGLGDTETPMNADWSLQAQAGMIVGFIDALDIENTHIVGHDHGGAVAQLLAAKYPERINRLILSNAEAYDNWPSETERPFVKLTQVPVLGNIIMWLYARRPIFQFALREAKAVKDPQKLTTELLNGYIRANLSSRHRRKKTKRFLACQFDPENNRTTQEILDDLGQFDHPALLLWGKDDVHFGVEWGQRLLEDIPGAVRLDVLKDAGHLVMEEQPGLFAKHLLDFLSEPVDNETTG